LTWKLECFFDWTDGTGQYEHGDGPEKAYCDGKGVNRRGPPQTFEK